jgi:hypothetical protein
LIAVKYLGEEFALASARDTKLFHFTNGSYKIALIMAVALPTPVGSALTMCSPDMRGHLFFKDLLDGSFNAFTNASLDVLMDSLS